MLEEHLEPLMKYVNMPRAAEVLVNRFGEVWVELAGEPAKPYKAPKLDKVYFERLARILANDNDIVSFATKPILKVTLPGGHRLTIGIGRFIQSGVALSIRVARRQRFKLTDYGVTPGQMEMITHAILYKKNIVVSGGTYTGKTQFTNAMLALIDPSERVVSAEDVLELDLEHCSNRVQFVVNQQETDLRIAYNDVIDMATRIRPDRFVLGELTMANTWSLLRLLNTGHGGLVTTLHANSPLLAFQAIERNIQLAGQDIKGVHEYFRDTIDMIIQLKRRPNSPVREVAEIYSREEFNHPANHHAVAAE